jgi:hypothetical protein
LKKPDNLIVIILWEFLSAFVALIGICVVAVFIAVPDILEGLRGSAALPGAAIIFSVSILVLICYIGIAIAGGIGLLKSKEWGRILSIIHSAFGLVSFPVGTAIGIIIIIYLSKSEVKDYFQGGGG